MGSLLSVPAAVLLLGIGYVLLKVVVNYFGRLPLDNVPGPSSGHWLDGKPPNVYLIAPPQSDSNVTGNFIQFFSRTGWDFYHHVSHNYGSVVKFYGFLGVRSGFFSDTTRVNPGNGHIVQMSLRLRSSGLSERRSKRSIRLRGDTNIFEAGIII